MDEMAETLEAIVREDISIECAKAKLKRFEQENKRMRQELKREKEKLNNRRK